MTFADQVLAFNRQLHYTGKKLPDGIRVMNPFRESEQAQQIATLFYKKYYNDRRKRFMLLGINPGRFGTGLTGIPFTDPKRLISECGITYDGRLTHETSSVFVYDMINAYGGTKAFYRHFYIHSVCPLGFTAQAGGKEKNYNYYDSKELYAATHDFIVENLYKQLSFGIDRRACICLGNVVNERFLRRLNDEHGFFDAILALEHPRFVMQYRLKQKQLYIDKYLSALKSLDQLR